MKHEASIEIDRPIEQVFDYANNHVAQWSIIVVEDEPLEKKDGGVGSTFRIVTEEHGRRMDFAGVVTHWDPPRSSAVHMTGKSFDIDSRYDFEDIGGRTRVTQVSTAKGKGFVGLFFRCCGWMMRKAACDAAQRELESLKQKLEAMPRAEAGSEVRAPGA